MINTATNGKAHQRTPATAIGAAQARPKKPLICDPNMIMDLETARARLGLTESCLKREIRKGRLRASRRAGRYWILGAWLLEWISAGEAPREPLAFNADEPTLHDS